MDDQFNQNTANNAEQPFNPYANPQQGNPYVNRQQGNPNAGPQPQGEPHVNQAQQPQGNVPPNNPYAAPPIRQKPARRRSVGRDVVMAVLLGISCFIMVDCYLWTGTLGMGFAIGAMVFLIAEVWYIAPFVKRKSVYSVLCIVLFAAGCVSLAFSADFFYKLLTLLGLMVLSACMVMDSMDLRTSEPDSFGSIGDYFYVVYAASFGKIGAGMYGLFHREAKDGAKKKAGFGKALLGLLIALPFVALLAFLLYNGDEAFRGMLDNIDLDKAPQKMLSIILAIPAFILLFSRLFSLRDLKRERRQESGKGLDPTVLFFFLLGVSIVYIAYLFSQLAYFFNGFMSFLPQDFTYAEYARRGFFELTVVSMINIVIVILCTALCRKKEGKLPLGVKLASLFLCVFSLVLAFTEFAKMKMYMDNYGLTRLRVLTVLFMLFLAVVFLTLIVRLFIRKTPYMKVAVIFGAALVIALNFVNIDSVIAQYNVNAYETGKLETIDVHTITRLNDAAVPYLLELADDKDTEVAQEAIDSLYYRWRILHKNGKWDSSKWEYAPGELIDYDYKGFNLTSHQARTLLLANEEMILSRRTTE